MAGGLRSEKEIKREEKVAAFQREQRQLEQQQQRQQEELEAREDEDDDKAQSDGDDSSTRSNAVEGSDRNGDERSDLSDAPSGEGALLAATELLLQRLRTDARLAPWARHSDQASLYRHCRSFLGTAFEGGRWPEVPVDPRLVEGDSAEGLVGAVLGCLGRPLPLGEDALCSALARLQRFPEEDARAGAFLETLRTAAFSLPGGDLVLKTSSARPPQPHLVESGPSLEARPLLGESDGQELAELLEASPTTPLAANPLAEGKPPRPRPAARAATLRPSAGGKKRGAGSAAPAAARTAPLDAPAMNVQTLETLTLKREMVLAIQSSWSDFVHTAGSKQAAGEVVFGALFEAAPAMQKMFGPMSVHAVRFAAGLDSLAAAAGKPAELKESVEAMGFVHMSLDITVDKAEVFREALLSAMRSELQERFSPQAALGWHMLFNYSSGAIVYTRNHHRNRIKALLHSWRLANSTDKEDRSGRAGRPSSTESAGGSGDDSDDNGSGVQATTEQATGALDAPRTSMSGRTWSAASALGRRRQFARAQQSSAETLASDNSGDKVTGKKTRRSVQNTSVPQTYAEMFEWNVIVMGFGGSTWLRQILLSFDVMVRSVEDPQRLTEECEVVALRITKMTGGGHVNLGQYRSCMLAALRSRLPKIWDGTYEVAWTWLWDNIERRLKQTLGKSVEWERSLRSHMAALEQQDGMMNDVRSRTYDRFFELAPRGQDFFKQSNTRLHFISARIQDMIIEIYKDPWKVVEEISAIGLRHVGYGVPTDLIPPFVTASSEVQGTTTASEVALEAYKWSLGLIASILTRTVREGSTIVMKAINSNSARELKKAISEAPRGQRAEWLLNVQVGTHRISPLMWALESGKLQAASAVIRDLLTIRADREQYYYGVEDLFGQHPDIVKRLCKDAPKLLHTLFEGLVWRSRHTKNGMRRVNYYVKHLVVNTEGKLSDALDALAKAKDQESMSHPVIVLVSDTLWTGVIRRQFVLSRLGFLLNLLIFMLSQAILPKSSDDSGALRWLILCGRVINYTFSVFRLGKTHAQGIYRSWAEGNTTKVLCFRVPKYLADSKVFLSLILLLMLICMLTQEPMIWCLGSWDVWPTEDCPQANERATPYSLASMIAMVILWALLIDMAVFSTKLQAFVLVIKHVVTEVGRFAMTLLFVVLTFASALSCLRQTESMEFYDVPQSIKCLFAITVGLYEGDYRELTHDSFLLAGVLMFVSVSTILLINLLIAQLNCSYEYVYQDMVGFARLARASLICDTLASCPPSRWRRFVDTLKFDQRLEFDEGDLGLAGGIHKREAGSLHPMTVDSIKRYGGTCNRNMRWPEDAAVDEDEKLDRVEQLLQTALKSVSESLRARGKSGRGPLRTSLEGSSGDSLSSSQMSSGSEARAVGPRRSGAAD